MTIEEWLGHANPEALADELARFGDRPLRLFACACLRRVWPLLPAESWREAVEAHEQYADGRLRKADLLEVCVKAELETAEGFWASRGSVYDLCDCPSCERTAEAALLKDMQQSPPQSEWLAAKAVFYAADLAAWEAEPVRRLGARRDERRAQYPLFCDILGRPKLVQFEPSWLRWNEGCVVKVAQAIHRRDRFGDLPILGDALEEAGCTSEVILGHCRLNKVHARGCWVVEALLRPGSP
jgi:hypothetical protein